MIRPTTEHDLSAIRTIHLQAFGNEQGPEIVELVLGLLKDESAKPFTSLIAEVDGRGVGHILFTATKLEPDEQQFASNILAPLGVAKDFQGKGVGRSLIVEGLRYLREKNVSIVFVLGHPEYYSKFGFQPAAAVGFEAPYRIPPEHSDAWMVLELHPGAIGLAKGVVRCAHTLDDERHWRE